MTEKTCGKCLTSKPREDHFTKDKSQQDGYCRYCKSCRREKRQKWYAEHREEKRELDRLYHIKNREIRCERERRRRAENPEKHRAYFRNRYATDPEFAAAKKRAARNLELANPEKKLARSRAYNAKHRYRNHLRYHYGLTLEMYNAMVAAQGGRCAICNGEPTGRRKKLLVDHNHATGKVRQLLCYKCNLIVGVFETSFDLIAKASEYIARHA